MSKNETAPLLGSTEHPGWQPKEWYNDPDAFAREMAERRKQLDAARANLGLQAVSDEQFAAQTAPAPAPVEDTKTRLEALAQAMPGPSPESLKELARIQGDRDAARGLLQAKLRRELQPTYDRAAVASQEIEAIVKEFRPVLTDLAKVPDESYLRALPENEASRTLVFQMQNTITSLLASFREAVSSIVKQGEGLKNAIDQLAGPTLTPQNKADVVRERDALQNLIEQPGELLNRVKLVLAYRESIERQSTEEGQRAVTTASQPDIEQTPAGRLALARKLGRS